jgi:hypothetical protein
MRTNSKSPSENSESDRQFFGVCNQCAETYEARSKTDNLIGTTFKCKKMLCTGKVTMKPKEDEFKAEKPRRYC